MNFGKVVCATLFMVLLAGCAGMVKQNFVEYHTTAGPQLFRYAAVDRDFHTVIYGNPTTASKAAFDTAVLAAMQASSYGAETRFVVRPTENMRPGYRLVLAFTDDPVALRMSTICAAVDPAAIGNAAPTVYLQAAFCFEDEVLTRTKLEFGPLAAPGDPQLAMAVTQSVRGLFQRDPTIAGEGRDTP